MTPAPGKRRIYLFGPMSGIPEFNFPAFNEAAKILRGLGHQVINPAELDDPDHQPGSMPWAWYLARDLREMLTCDTLVALPGWRRSKGARLEHHVGAELGKDIYELAEFIELHHPDLQEATIAG